MMSNNHSEPDFGIHDVNQAELDAYHVASPEFLESRGQRKTIIFKDESAYYPENGECDE